jgi:hypothetical protein
VNNKDQHSIKQHNETTCEEIDCGFLKLMYNFRGEDSFHIEPYNYWLCTEGHIDNQKGKKCIDYYKDIYD